MDDGTEMIAKPGGSAICGVLLVRARYPLDQSSRSADPSSRTSVSTVADLGHSLDWGT